MSTSNGEMSGVVDGEAGDGTTGRIEDPDDYNLRRRLKQLHTAKEAVITRKDNALDLERRKNDKQFPPQTRDRFVVEKVVDYIHELRPLLKKVGREDEFCSEIVTFGGGEVSIGEIIERRGRAPDQSETEYLPYEASMAAWDICNEYFEDVAGAVFEQESASPDQNPVDPAGRFNE
jgi:hypothetical protein